MSGRTDWHETNNMFGYHQRVYSDRKVGHVMQTWHDEYKAFHDGIYLATVDTLEQAQLIVDERATT